MPTTWAMAVVAIILGEQHLACFFFTGWAGGLLVVMNVVDVTKKRFDVCAGFCKLILPGLMKRKLILGFDFHEKSDLEIRATMLMKA